MTAAADQLWMFDGGQPEPEPVRKPQVDLRFGDCLDVLRTLPDCSVSAVVTDPPYGLADHRPDTVTAALTAWCSGDRDHVPSGRGFMSREWDAFVPPPAVWDECLRVLKPGGWLLAFSAPRTADLMGLAIRLAGLEVRDSLMWVTGQGFPKGKGQLKPAHEPVVVARKRAPSPVLNIDACRVPHGADVDLDEVQRQHAANDIYIGGAKPGDEIAMYKPGGRWPSNVVLTHTPDCADRCGEGCPVAELDTQSGNCRSSGHYAKGSRRSGPKTGDASIPINGHTSTSYADSGAASRFFPTFRYCAKAPTRERPKIDGQGWPTVKPLALMRWLVRLVTPPGGLVLDPFAGTGTTLQACELEGFDSIGVERDDLAYRLACQRLGIGEEVA